MTPLKQLVQDWLDLDKVRIITPDEYHLVSLHIQSEETRSEIRKLWESGNHKELESRLRYLSPRPTFRCQTVRFHSKGENTVWDCGSVYTSPT